MDHLLIHCTYAYSLWTSVSCMLVWCFLGAALTCGGVVGELDRGFWSPLVCSYLGGHSIASYVDSLGRVKPNLEGGTFSSRAKMVFLAFLI